MEFTKLEKDLSHVSALPDTPTLENGYTPKALKETFDRAGADIKEYINEVLIAELESSGAARIGSGEIETVDGVSIQEKLEGLARQIQDISNASIPEGTLVPEKFVPSVASFITEGSPRCEYYSEPGEYTFIPTRSGNFKITVQGAGAGGGTFGNYKYPCGGGSGAVAIGWLRLEKGESYTVRIGRGGKSITLDSDNKFVSSPENGERSGFYRESEELLFAEGGSVQMNVARIPIARGGKINLTGSFPMLANYSSGVSYYSYGAASHFASQTVSNTIKAGAGAGGYGAPSPTSGVYSSPGTAGGDGAVLIEWME